MHTLISDGGSMTVGRRTANYTWGAFEVVLPEGLEQQETEERLQDGYIYRPDDRGHGRAELTFVRADARIDMNAQRSDLEQTLDGASERTKGDAYYTRQISGVGLGKTTPGVDYRQGDMVRVKLWAKYLELPITAIIRGKSADGSTADVAAQVGGQMLRDAELLRKRNDDVDSQIAAEKRERLRQVGAVDSKATQAKNTADSALNAVNDADGVIQGEVKKAKDYSQQSYIHSEASLLHSQKSLEHSETSQGFSQAAWDANEAAQGHAQNAWDYSEAAQGHSLESLGHSQTSFTHSDAARVYSEAANTSSLQAKQYSEQVQALQPAIERAASDAQAASQQSSQHSADAKSASEQSSVHSKAATDAAELSQDALRLAELARDAAETSRRDAESKRDEAEQARRAGFAAMTAASAAMAMAEQAREDAEESRRLAENERKAAEDQRRLAESARATAETHRNNAEESRKLAFNSMVIAQNNMAMAEKQRAMAERERALAEEKRAAAEEQRRLAEGEREKAETAREQTVAAFTATQNEIDDMQNDAIEALESQAAEIAELQNRSTNTAMVDREGSTHPDVTIFKLVNTTAYDVSVKNVAPGTKIHADFYTRASSGALSHVKSEQYATTSTSHGISASSGTQVINLMWARPNAQQVPISLSSPGASPARITWTDVSGLSRRATGRVTNGQLTIRATWEAANRGSTYGIRVLVGTSVFKSFTTTTLGPLSFLGGGDSRYTVSVSNLKMNAGQTFKVQVYSSAGTTLQRSVKSATATGSWIEHAS